MTDRYLEICCVDWRLARNGMVFSSPHFNFRLSSRMVSPNEDVILFAVVFRKLSFAWGFFFACRVGVTTLSFETIPKLAHELCSYGSNIHGFGYRGNQLVANCTVVTAAVLSWQIPSIFDVLLVQWLIQMPLSLNSAPVRMSAAATTMPFLWSSESVFLTYIPVDR